MAGSWCRHHKLQSIFYIHKLLKAINSQKRTNSCTTQSGLRSKWRSKSTYLVHSPKWPSRRNSNLMSLTLILSLFLKMAIHNIRHLLHATKVSQNSDGHAMWKFYGDIWKLGWLQGKCLFCFLPRHEGKFFSSNNFITTLTLGHLYPNYSSYSYGAELYYPNVLTLIGNRFLCESLTYSTRKVVCAENGLTRKMIVSWTKF